MESFELSLEKIAEIQDSIESFCDRNRSRRIALVTSGGTAVCLEKRAVRTIENFSTGKRAANSAEYLLKNGYAVLFLYRRNSLRPFAQHLQHSSQGVETGIYEFNRIERDDGDFKFKPTDKRFFELYDLYQLVNSEQRLLLISFFDIREYLGMLKYTAGFLTKFGPKALIYLAAAVSDFYIPENELAEHKIQSEDGPPSLTLELVPKMITPFVKNIVPEAFLVSFKLETNEEILHRKSLVALERYNHQVVVGNVLEKRRKEVTLMTKDTSKTIALTDDSTNKSEIEEKIIEELLKLHSNFCL